MTEREHLVALYSFLPFGPARCRLLVSYFSSAKNSWNADPGELREIGLKDELISKFESFRKNFNKRNYFGRLEKHKIHYIIHTDKNYPENLKDLENAPLVLYILGKINRNDSNAIAIVGTRKMTSYGKDVASKFAGELASMGLTIVSGLALGVDAVAHMAAMNTGGRTIAVLASGLNIITPASNINIAKRIINGNGAILSEYPLDHPPLRTDFASRNRIVSGLSKGVVVVEGAMKSGTLLTASAAATQGRQVFAVPGQITSVMSAAPHFLLNNGAKLATNSKDILEELDLQFKVDRQAVEKVMPSDKNEAKMTEILANEPLHLDEIARISKLEVSQVSARLTIMEMKGLVKNLGNGVYKKN